MPQWLLNGGFQIQDFTPNEFLGASVESRISSVYDVDRVGGFLETLGSILHVVFIVLLALLLLVLLKWMFLEGLAQINALKDRVLFFWMQRAWPVEELLEVILLISLFAVLTTIDRC